LIGRAQPQHRHGAIGFGAEEAFTPGWFSRGFSYLIKTGYTAYRSVCIEAAGLSDQFCQKISADDQNQQKAAS
jgi:hypothetical protein